MLKYCYTIKNQTAGRIICWYWTDIIMLLVRFLKNIIRQLRQFHISTSLWQQDGRCEADNDCMFTVVLTTAKLETRKLERL